jgi:hypothetical protein
MSKIAGARCDEYGLKRAGSLESRVLHCCRHTRTRSTLVAANKPATVFADVLEKLNHVADSWSRGTKRDGRQLGGNADMPEKRIM